MVCEHVLSDLANGQTAAHELSDELLPKGAAYSKQRFNVAHAVSAHLQSINPETAPNHVRKLNWPWVPQSELVDKHVQMQ